MSFSIRPLREQDFPEVLKAVEGIGVSPAFYWPPEALEPELRWAEGWGLWEDQELVAFVLYRPTGDRNEITCLGTARHWQGRGRMGILLKTVFTEVDNAPWLLEVHQDNRNAQKLYEGLGFIRVGVRRKYYKDLADAYVYRREPGF